VDQPVNITGRQMFFRFWTVGRNGSFLFNEESLFDEVDVISVMNPQSHVLANSGIPAGRYDRISVSPDGSGLAVEEQLVVPDGDYPNVSRDGKWLAFATSHDLRALNLETGEIAVLDSTSSKQGDAKISPNGRFIAFTADNHNTAFVSGGQRMYVRSFPDPTQYFERVTEIYADDPEWAADGSGLYFRNRGEISFLPVSTATRFTQRGQPRQVAQVRGVNVRMATDPSSGDVLIVHPPGASSIDNRSRFQLIEGLPTFLERRLQQ
jgi:dipeptidyl aminopeptidase/acylaminoacyl peptidase